MKHLLTIFLLWHGSLVFSQQTLNKEQDELNSSQLEELSESEEAESEDDYDMQQLSAYIKHPININSLSTSWSEFPMLDALLISNLCNYRKLLGDLLSVHELQAVPGFSIELIKRILPYITIEVDNPGVESIKKRFIGGDHSFLIRPLITPEPLNGFLQSVRGPSLKFTGSRPALFIRHKYQYRNLLQYGILADKDAGERFYTGRHIPEPDFYSFHFFIKRIGCIKSLAIGDYTVNLGQGLVHWQSQAFKKSSGVINIKRQSETLRPYHSAGEYNFHRGMAATFNKGILEGTFFGSVRKLSANISLNETYGPVITSFQTSGLHRTESEFADKDKATLTVTGASIKIIKRSGHAALNAVKYHYSLPILKRDEPFNLFAIKGKNWSGYSIDYSYTFRNFHFFGEAALDEKLSFAFINGMMSSLDGSIDIALLQRSISKSYQSVFGNAFTENTLPANENGFYTGITIKPDYKWKLDLYADLFSFPWLKFRLNAPAGGLQYLAQISWKPNKKVEVYSRFRCRMKPLNIEDEAGLSFPEAHIIQNWRTQFAFQATPDILIRSRMEICLFSNPDLSSPESGYLFYTDIIFKPLGKRFSGNIRFQSFETNGYNTRIYAYENDLLYVSSTPSFFNNGVRYYLNLKGKFRIKALSNKLLLISFKAASTVYNNLSVIGSGTTAINGSRKSDLKLQVLLVPAS